MSAIGAEYRDPSIDGRSGVATRARLVASGFREVNEMTARLSLAARSATVTVVVRTVWNGVRGSYQSAAWMQETPSGAVSYSRGWRHTRSVREECYARDAERAAFGWAPELEWFILETDFSES
jgi:hypothetical protein